VADDPHAPVERPADASSGEVVLRLSALCSLPVVDADGRHHGTVLDARLVRDGPANVSGDAAIRIDGLVVGSDGWPERLGLFRHAVHGPWLLVQVARRLGPRRSYLPWDQLLAPHELATASAVRFRGDLEELPDLPN
jgi:hypothetical protein